MSSTSRPRFAGKQGAGSTWPVSGFAERHAHAVAAGASTGAQIASLGIGFDPVSTILQLRARGVSVALAADGGIAIDPASALNATDLAALNNPERRRAPAAVLLDRRCALTLRAHGCEQLGVMIAAEKTRIAGEAMTELASLPPDVRGLSGPDYEAAKRRALKLTRRALDPKP
jgi:hypothetical protein